MKTTFEEYKENLFQILQSDNPINEFLNLINKLKEKGYSKKEIYNLFLDFHSEIQIDERTKDSEKLYDILSDFCLLYTSPSPRDQRGSRMPSSA